MSKNSKSSGMSEVANRLAEKPKNGIAGLKHWTYDLRSGFMVAMVSLPFSMGIAITSGAPPITGVISAIIAGFLLPFLGGAYVTISGPAAGLAPALYGGMIALATAEVGKEVASGKTTQELLEIGFPLVLVAISIAGALQIVLARLKVARFSAIFPASAIEGMLAAIGLIIMVKQLPLLFGVDFEAHEFWGMILEIPEHTTEIYAPALVTGVCCTAALFVLNALPYKFLKIVPPPVWVFIVGSIVFQSVFQIPTGQFSHEQRQVHELIKHQLTPDHQQMVTRLNEELKTDLERQDLTNEERFALHSLHEQLERGLLKNELTESQIEAINQFRSDLSPEQIEEYEKLPHLGYCINIPENPIGGGIQLPDFTRIIRQPHTWGVLIYVVLVLLLIDATESLATIVAVDKLDPFKRRSDPDGTLQAMGGCNLASSVVGGLTIIPGIVKSTTNIIGGGRTLWANFFNAVTLLVFLLFARPLINQVPLAVLASILIFVGWKLCGPKVWIRTASIGIEQLAVFVVTLVVTVSTDLLVGIFVGVFLKLLMDVSLIGLVKRIAIGENEIVGSEGGFLRRFFRNPATKSELEGGGTYSVFFDKPLHCFNLFHVIRELQEVPKEVSTLRLHLSPSVTVIDHTAVETILHYLDDYQRRGVSVELKNWERFVPLSSHPAAIRVQLGERQQKARVSVASTR